MIFVSLIVPFLYTLALSSIALCTSEPLGTRRSLVPVKRIPRIVARELWHHDIVPKNQAQLEYGISTYHPSSASLIFTAHDGHPILLLEDIDYLLNNVACASLPDTDGETIMELTFRSEDALEEALEEWIEQRTFTIVTAHPACNSDGERGAWAVQSIAGDFLQRTINLSVRSIGLHSVGQSCRIKYNDGGRTTREPDETLTKLSKRAHQKVTNTSSGGYSPDFPSRTTLFPLKPGNVTLVPQNVTDKLDGVDIQLTCVDCTFKSDFAVGVEFSIDFPDSPCVVSATNQCFTLSNATMNVTVVDFEHSANLEVALGSEYSGAFNFTILHILLDGFGVPNFIRIGPAIGLEVGLDLDVSADVNFTYGAKAQIPSGTSTSFNLVDVNGKWNPAFQTDGWQNAGVDQIPFRVNSGQFNVTATMFLAPYAEVAFEILNFGATARIIETVPKVTVDASLLTAVTRNCTPIGDNDFESFTTAFAVGADMEIGTTAHFEIDAGVLPEALGFPNEYDYPFLTFDFPLLPTNGTEKQECFVLVDDTPGTTSSAASSSGAIVSTSLTGVPAATGTMFSAASAVPTWDFTKIESYYSANGHLPTNVNYQQMVAATTVPSPILQAVQSLTMTSGAPRITSLDRWTLLSSAFALVIVLL